MLKANGKSNFYFKRNKNFSTLNKGKMYRKERVKRGWRVDVAPKTKYQLNKENVL